MPMDFEQCSVWSCREEIWTEPVPRRKCQTHMEEQRRKDKAAQARNNALGLDAVRPIGGTTTERWKREYIRAAERDGLPLTAWIDAACRDYYNRTTGNTTEGE